MQGQICDILRPQLAMNRFLTLWPQSFPHFGCIHLWGRGVGGSDIRSMSSIRPICKCRCPPLQVSLKISIIAIYGPLIYTAQYVILLMRANTLRGQVGSGGALEIKTFLGPVKWHRAVKRVPFGAQKRSMS